jgi:hypothetical protein
MRWTLEQLDEWLGREALDADAETVGTVIATFIDEDNSAPRWLGVRTGEHGDAAPHVPASAGLSPEQDEQLASFYGLG